MMRKLKLGSIHADYLTMAEAIDAVVALSRAKKGGYVVTPNVDHVVIAERNSLMRSAYKDAALSLVDGMPLLWASRLAGLPLPEKVSGSDLVRPLLKRMAEENLSCYLLGAAEGVGAKAAENLLAELPSLRIVGIDSPPLGFESDPDMESSVFNRMLSANPDIILVALGCPKQEILMHRWYMRGAVPVMLGIGATLDFIAGKVKRAPGWMSEVGLEWVYRISQDPKRLAKRYLIQDMAIFGIIFRLLRLPKDQRVFR